MSKVKLSALGEFKNGLNFSSNDVDKGCKIIGVSNFGDKYIAEYSNLNQVSKEIITDDYLLKNGDILFVRSNGNKALIGRTLLIQNLPEAISYSGFCIRFRPNQEICYPLFVLYLLKSPIYRKAFSNTQQTNINNLNQQILGNLEIQLPDIIEQKRIADKIHLLTMKIQLNNKINAELEEMAKTLYDYWFTQFDFPNAEGKPYRSSGGKLSNCNK